jgi:hypothetical protein
MNEQQLRDGMREVMVASSPPPSMNPNTALDTARRAHKRRRATWAGVGAGAAVVALAAGSVFALTGTGGGEPLPIDPASGGTSAAGPGQPTKTEWPDGQTDRTARSGPQADKGKAVLETLKATLPATLVVDATMSHPGSSDPVTGHQAQLEAYVDGDQNKQVWEYLATAAVHLKAEPNGGTGRVIVEVTTPGGTSSDVCDLATRQFWSVGGSCQTRQVQGKTVGVVTKTDDPRIDQVAAYRYEDGSTVVVAHSKAPDNSGVSGRNNGPSAKGMSQPPLTLDQLATLAINPAFKAG